MFEFTNAFLKPYAWAKQAYNYFLGANVPDKVTLTPENLVAPILPSIDSDEVEVTTSTDWNTYTNMTVGTLGGLFKSLDQASEYYSSLYTTVTSRLSEAEKRLQELDGSLRVLVSASNLVASTSIHVKGGDLSSIDTDSKFYRDFVLLESVPEENLFRLKDTGHFSSIRSLGGFAGVVAIDNSLGHITEAGNLKNITDGSRDSFWMGAFYAPAPIRADENDIPWLPPEYKHGFAFQISYYMDRPTLATELFIDPVSTEPFDLVAVSWTPMGLSNTLTDVDFPGSGWTYTGTSVAVTGIGANSGSALVTTNASGYASKTFAIPNSTLVTGSTGLVYAGNRVELFYNLKGIGDCYAGARLTWLNSSGQALTYKLQEDFPPASYTVFRLIDSIPTGAVSGKIEFGIFTSASSAATAIIDEPILLIGEEERLYGVTLDKPTTVSLPKIVCSNRFTVTFAQRNPRREVMSKEGVDEIPNQLDGLNIDPTLIEQTQNLIDRTASRGSGDSVFAYRVGLKELDFRYREHYPHGALVTKPLITNKEIRRIWVTTEMAKEDANGVSFKVYPFKDDAEKSIGTNPFIMGDTIANSTSMLRDGDILYIYTDEELNAGWVNRTDVFTIVSPKKLVQTFTGTDRDGKIKLPAPIHLRRPTMKSLTTWMDNYCIWAKSFDPNAAVVYGMADGTNKDNLRNGTLSTPLSLSDFVSTKGYQPVKVTITTDKFVARPDIYGKPDLSRIRKRSNEILGSTDLVQTVTVEKQDHITYDSWLNTVMCQDVKSLSNATSILGVSWIQQLSKQSGKSLKQYLTTVYNLDINARIRRLYSYLAAQNQLGVDQSKTVQVQATVKDGQAFQTQFAPLVVGPRGAFFQLFWHNPGSGEFLPVPQNGYEIMDYERGVIKLSVTAPSTSYTEVVANYNYLSSTDTEDHLSSVLAFINDPAANTSDLASQFINQGKTFPLTRNMTDYVEGKVPELRPPNFTVLSKDYYPIIEYYVTSEGEIQFARDFHLFGDMPATIQIELETLDIAPRIGLEVKREGSSATTPRIYNFSLRVLEATPAYNRETT